MAIPYDGLYFEADGGAVLTFKSATARKGWRVFYSPAPDALVRATDANSKFAPPKLPILLAEGGFTDDLIVLHPLTMDANSPNFLEPRHDPLLTVTLSGFGFSHVEDLDEFLDCLKRLPTGFIRNPYRGLGLNYDLRQILDTVNRLKDLNDLRIVKRISGDPVIERKSFVLPYVTFEAARKDIGRIHSKALSTARTEKATRLSDRLLHPVDAERFPTIGQPYHPDAILKAVGDGIGLGVELSPADSKVLIEATTGLINEVAQREPRQLLKLTEAVETVTLEAMIAHMRARIRASHSEGSWQKFLMDNAFILRLAFGIPVILFKEQATVGGRSYDGAGDKKTDFLMQAARSGNLSIIEIKTPSTDLLEKGHYRVGLHAPHPDLSGAVSQVMDQRWQLQRNNVQMADEFRRKGGQSDEADVPALPPETYSVQCVVIAGTMPVELNLLKSFELYRSGLTGVVVITYDELLLKLQTLLGLLKDPGAQTFVVPTVTTKRPARRRPGPGAKVRRQ